ncbi:hypothetical protein [Caballeronia sordidicola]|uniref:hypothetical protein n=1 Tax=Caballeronia sordidicola TaxID=196367 RepID=UPI0011813B3B|nr:hypothetical protein [Caballeronia sordidicola]
MTKSFAIASARVLASLALVFVAQSKVSAQACNPALAAGYLYQCPQPQSSYFDHQRFGPNNRDGYQNYRGFNDNRFDGYRSNDGHRPDGFNGSHGGSSRGGMGRDR